MGLTRQEYWNALPFPSPGDLPNPGIEPPYPALQVDSLLSEPPEKAVKKEMATYSNVLPRKSHGQRNLTGYNPWGHKELDTTE